MAKQPKLGSGDRFQKLSATLAARGASNPDALAAWIGRRKYGAKRMGGLSHSHANSLTGLLLAGDSEEGGSLKCPNCGYSGDPQSFSGNTLQPPSSTPAQLRTPDRTQTASAGMNSSQGVSVTGGSAPHALANTGQRVVGLAQRLPVSSATDILVSRGLDGRATVRHRQGGATIGQIWRDGDGTWRTAPDGGKELNPHQHQRGALVELLGTWNRAATRPDRWAQPLPAAQAPQQTPLMERFGIPAVRSLATPTNGAGDGPRTTAADPGGGNGLNPKGQAIYKKLLAKGFPAARALAFAKNSQNAKPGQFSKAN